MQSAVDGVIVRPKVHDDDDDDLPTPPPSRPLALGPWPLALGPWPLGSCPLALGLGHWTAPRRLRLLVALAAGGMPTGTVVTVDY
jgi:hypothetical protein